MTLTEFPDVVQGSDEWHDQRRGMVTASVVGRLITTRARAAIEYGCSECDVFPGVPCVGKRDKLPIKTVHPARADAARFDTAPPELVTADTDDARSLTTLLVAERITGWTEPTHMTDAMWRGVDDEPRAREVYAEHYAPVREVGFLVRREDTWAPGFTLGYSPDGLVGDDGLIEIKSRAPKKQLATILADEVPPEVMPQLQSGLLVSGRKWCDYVSYAGGMPLYVKRVLPDQRWHDAIVEAVTRFEETAGRMVAAYETAIEGRPMTERTVEQEMAI